MAEKETETGKNPAWYKDAVVYQLHVKAFCDGNGDGIGDFKGLTEKLGYLEDLGITAVWLLPFYPSPFKDDGYDLSDYFNVHPDYGTIKDFQRFLAEAHKRGLRVITELVVNHTSDQHPWFQRARKAPPGSSEREFYVWSDTAEKYKDARIIFKDFESSNWQFDPVAKLYFWHRFYNHQPDLNYDNPAVQEAVIRVMDYWLKMGVDGLRLDAVPYLFEREGTNCENLPETHAYLKKLRAHMDSHFPNRMLLAEANQWPEDAAAYFGQGDESHMAFHFPLMPRMFMAVRMEDRFPVVDILEQTPSIPEGCQWAIFLRNHDELTLEMVTDEERDYMYRVYARDPKARINLGIRRRLAPLMENDRRKIELMAVLLLSLPGTPILYYGDEIGMGDNHYLGDRNGVRTPMQWTADRNAGFSKANPQRLFLPVIIDPEYHYESLNVENHERSPFSLLWWMKRMIAVRQGLRSLSRGSIEFLAPENSKVLAFIRAYEAECVLVLVNLSRHSQVVQLNLESHIGKIPLEVFSQNEFPAIKRPSYSFTLGPYGYFLFSLKEVRTPALASPRENLPVLGSLKNWAAVFQGKTLAMLEKEILPGYIRGMRWFGGKARKLQRLKISEKIFLGRGPLSPTLLFLEVEYTEGLAETYLLPAFAVLGEGAAGFVRDFPGAAVARVQLPEGEGVLADGLYVEEVRSALFDLIARRQKVRGLDGEVIGAPAKGFRKIAAAEPVSPEPSRVIHAEQSNSSVFFPNGLILKIFRRLDEGLNPELEVSRFLTERLNYSHTPPFAGSIEYQKRGVEPVGIGVLNRFVPNEGDGWTYTRDEVLRFFERILSRELQFPDALESHLSPLAVAFQGIPALAQELIGGVYLERAHLLGKRTGEFHLALASEPGDSQFSPEEMSALYQRSLYQSFQSSSRRTFQLLRKEIDALPVEARVEAESILKREDELYGRFKILLNKKFSALRIRIHGDYHLGQVLVTGSDFFIIDLEGEPTRPVTERRIKRSPLRDVAGMVRSFHYAVYHALFQHTSFRKADRPVLEPWADLWHRYVAATFFKSYLSTVDDSPIIPRESKDLDDLTNLFLLNKAVYELNYELNNRPDWALIPLLGIRSILDISTSTALFLEIERAFPSGLPGP